MRMTSWNGGRPTRPSSQPSIVPGADADDLPEPRARVAGRLAPLLEEPGEGVLFEGHSGASLRLWICGYRQSTRLIRCHQAYYSIMSCISVLIAGSLHSVRSTEGGADEP